MINKCRFTLLLTANNQGDCMQFYSQVRYSWLMVHSGRLQWNNILQAQEITFPACLHFQYRTNFTTTENWLWSIKSSTDHQNMSKMSESSTNSHRPAIKQALSGQITDKHPQFCRSNIQGNIKVSESIKVLPAKKKQPKPFSNRKCILCIIMWQVTKHEELLKHLGHPNLHVRVPPTHLNEACVLLIH